MAETQSGEQTSKSPTDYFADELFRSLQPIFGAAMELGEWSEHLDWSKRLQSEGFLSTSGIIRAFETVSRYDFMPDDVKAQSGRNIPLPIGYGQTISQPSTVALMQEWLEPHKGHRILDFGSGSGWTTALMGIIVGNKGSVIGVERIPELVDFGRANMSKYNLPVAEIKQASEELGLPDENPFHRILVSAHLPESWLSELQQQLSPYGGRLIAPLVADKDYGTQEYNCDMVAVSRHGKEFETTKLARGFGFVPVVHEADDRFSLV